MKDHSKVNSLPQTLPLDTSVASCENFLSGSWSTMQVFPFLGDDRDCSLVVI